MLIPATLHAAYSNAERIALLQSLLDYNVPFSTEVPIDSIIKWEKILEPELEQQQQYSLLFQLKHLTVQALITKGNISLAIDKANLMYQKAKDMNYAPGTALSLQAIGNTYQSSSAAVAAIESYEEALEAARKIPNATPYTKTILSQLILTKLKYRQLTDIGNYIQATQIPLRQKQKSSGRLLPGLLPSILQHTDAPSSGSINLSATSRLNQSAFRQFLLSPDD